MSFDVADYCPMCGHEKDTASHVRKCDVAPLKLKLEVVEAQLRKAQEVINTHVADQIEGLHCVDCEAEADEMCDCPMLVPIFEAMKGYKPQQ